VRKNKVEKRFTASIFTVGGIKSYVDYLVYSPLKKPKLSLFSKNNPTFIL